MTTPPPTIDHDATLLELAYRLIARECPEVVVTSGDRPLGALTLRDLARAWPNEATILARRPASSLLPNRTRRVLPDLDIATVAAVMAEEQLDALPVVDRSGALIGVISARQIVELVAHDDPRDHQ
jgi:CBS domain-containing protein